MTSVRPICTATAVSQTINTLAYVAKLLLLAAATLLFSKTAAAVSFSKLIDPTERSFSVELPKGWNNQLGLTRTSGNFKMPRSWMTASSPDGSTQIFIGDLQVPVFQTQLPPEIQAAGPQEKRYTLDFLRKEGFAIKPYQSAQRFAAEYTQRRFGRNPGFRITSSTPNQRLQQATRELKKRLGSPPSPVETVTVMFEYGSYSGEVWVASGYAADDKNTWTADVSGFITTADPVSTSQTFAHSALSFDISPKWLARETQQMEQRQIAFQQQVQRQTQQVQAETQRLSNGHAGRMQAQRDNFNRHQNRMQQRSAAMDQQNQSWQAGQDASYEQHQGFVRGIHDRTVVNSASGSWEVDAGPGGHYINPNTNEHFGTEQPLDTWQVPEGYEEATEASW